MPKDPFEVTCEELRAAGWIVEDITDEALERTADPHEPTNVSAPSKAQHHCVND